MDQQFSYVVKEEIIRNVLKAHNRILVVGWPGTGRTVTSLKASAAFDDVYYYAEADPGKIPPVTEYNSAAKTLVSLSDLDNAGPAGVLVVDDIDGLSGPSLETVNGIISESTGPKKIVLIAVLLLAARLFLPSIEVVVRLKKDTAEMIYTGLLPGPA